ncbi:3-oxoacid CoA-transferase subunit A [Comamonas testosteroni]|uniref:3-oxoacid CoA-transferase, A subunit n=1 Tax=Comamonas testosteroni (strain DSM 14576 / KF-1) TaxID=399795 RepID=B7WWX5_COMTK|nr:3-oxoacid CoA-transferase subunit A [Comamonas testosteroni]EED67859.1 3-oxoacid CoA-transferase, A subunit [Comamonas testosteroni KF-1]WQG65979.1 3-oxoacid CoA-transferase subunit A [Comamonas testosteroni]
MINKILDSAAEAVADIADRSCILVSGFGLAGQPGELLDALYAQGASELTVVCNNSGSRDIGLARLIRAGRVRKLLASYPRGAESDAFESAYAQGRIEYECIPQGTLAERLRAAGAGLGGFLTPTGYGTELAAGKETRVIDGVGYVFEQPLHGDYALVQAHVADRWGNLLYRKAARNFGPIMCMAAKVSIVQVAEVATLGELNPESIVTPGIFVQRVVVNAAAAQERRA